MPGRKRRATVNADNDGSSSAKRPRFEDASDSDGQSSRARSRARNNTKGKGKARDEGSSDDEDQETVVNGIAHIDDDERFEEDNGERMREVVHAKHNTKQVGGIAQHGIIENVEMHQFMCHKYLTFEFGPQINFIIGHNGSGKSAVLSAISIALGGRTNSTGRGSGLKSFIREGQSVSEVTITLKNQGEEAYKPHEYGNSISITRRFTKEGSSSWKIKGSKSSRVISSKRDELAAICDHMNIQVDNPINVLTQDAARKFLSGSGSKDKYDLFLRGTLLAQLEEHYDTCNDHIQHTMNVLRHKQQSVSDLKQVREEAEARFVEANKAIEQQEKARDLKIELAWAHVRDKQKELEEEVRAVEREKRQLEKIADSLKEAQERLEEVNEEVRKYELDVDALGNVDDLHASRTVLKNKMRERRTEFQKCTADLQNIQISIRALDRTIAETDQSITAETERLATDTRAKREEFQRKMDQATANVKSLEGEIQEFAVRKSNAEQRGAAAKKEGEQKQTEQGELENHIKTIQENITALKRTENNKYAAYGDGMGQVIAQIPKMRWWGDVPLGPLGLYVKVKDPDAWADLLAQQLSAQLTAFAITDARDRDALKRLLNSKGVRGNQIIIFEKDLFDYRHGAPQDEGVLTVLRAIEVDDPYVERLLINARSIERWMLAHSRNEAEEVLKRAGGGNAWSRDLFHVRRYPEGGGSTIPFDKPRRSQMLRNEDTATRQRHLETELRELQAHHSSLAHEVTRLKMMYSTARQEITKISHDDRAAHGALSRAKKAVADLQKEDDDDVPVNISALQAAKKEAEDEKADLTTQFVAITRTREEHNSALSALKREDDELKAEINTFHARKNEATEQVTTAAAPRLQAQSDIKHFKDRAKVVEKDIEAAEAKVSETTNEFKEWTANATTIGPQVATTRTVREIEKLRESLKAAVRAHEERVGTSVDELCAELDRAKERHERARKDLRGLIHVNRILKESLKRRSEKWDLFRRFMALQCKWEFQYNLSQRGYFGKALFNHQERKLDLKVQTGDQVGTQINFKEKDPKVLSGGEKSFSTVCLLLSLWECIGCPLRCLDEFDVFMDAVNRRISMRMMIDTAKQSDKQYVLITPQDMQNIEPEPEVRVHRMTDPERGQGVLRTT